MLALFTCAHREDETPRPPAPHVLTASAREVLYARADVPASALAGGPVRLAFDTPGVETSARKRQTAGIRKVRGGARVREDATTTRSLSPSLTAMALIAVMVVLGSIIWFLNPAPYLMALVAALIAALMADRPVEAALTAGIGVALGAAAIHWTTTGPWHNIASWALFSAKTAIPAAIIAAGLVAWRINAPRVADLVLSWAGILVVIVAVWVVVIVYAGSPYLEGGASGTGLVEWLHTPPRITAQSPDESLYQAYIQGVAEGNGYYATAREALVYQNQVRDAPIDTGSPSAFRQPLLYVLLGNLGVGWPVVLAGLVMATATLLAGFVLGRMFVHPAVVLVGSALLGGFLVDYISTFTILDAELWAGMLVLCSIAVASVRPRSARFALGQHVLAASLAFLATVVREIAVPVFALGLAATLTNASLRKAKCWAPWLLGLIAFSAAYALHVSSVQPYLVPVPGYWTSASQFFHPDGKTIVATVLSVMQALQLQLWVAWIVMAAALAGAAIAPMGRTRRILIAGMTLGGALAVFLFRSPGIGLSRIKVPTHWALIVLPVMLACVPLVLARVLPAEGD